MARSPKPPLIIGALAALASITSPALADSATTTVFSGFYAQGPGEVTASTGNGSDTPPIGLPTFVAASIQFRDPLALGIAPDATGQFTFDQSDGLILVSVYNAEYPNGYPISGWSFQGGAVDYTLDSGLVTDFQIHGLAHGQSYVDIDPQTFRIHFDTGFQVYDFSGPWSIETLQSETRTFVVPEPSQWTLLLVGFGLTGLAMRQTRRKAAQAGRAPVHAAS